MREIKFRAYCKKRKAIFDVTGILFNQSDVVIQVLPDTNTLVNIENIELIQYTGLKDKNGREIYEGDIVMQLSERTYDSVTGVVKFIDGSYVIESADGKTGVYLFDEVAFNVLIGNIYENPELLEGSE